MMKLQDVILKAMAKKITWLEAAEIIGVCDRTMRRIRERYQEFGYDGLFDQRRRKRTYLRIPMAANTPIATPPRPRSTILYCPHRRGRTSQLANSRVRA